MVEVELPQYYMALVLADTSHGAPNADHLEASRIATIEYLQRHLQPNYPTLTKLDLEFANLQWKSDKPLPRFHVYWEVNTKAQFTTSGDDNNNEPSSPNPEELFESVGEAFDEDYREFLLKTVKGGGGGISSNTEEDDAVEGYSTPLESAKEVQVRRTKLPTAGGAVKAPPFYMAFVTSEEPTRKPNGEEIQKATKHVHDAATKELQKKYQDDFQEFKLLQIKRTEIGERAGIPQDEFKLYVEFEAVGEFTENTPEAMEFFRVISLVNQPEFILGFDNVGGPFDESEQIAMNVCAWFENGEDPPEEEIEPDDPDVGEMQPQDEPPKLVDVHLEFWVALVIPQLEELPSKEKTQKFDEIITEFVSQNVLKKQYKEKFHDWTVEAEQPKFEAGLPLLRFNMLHGYSATLQFQDPPPEPTDVLQRIVKCEVSMLMKKLKELEEDEDDPDSTRPWKETTEATFGSAFNPDPNDKVYGGKIDRPKFKGKPKKKVVEEEKPKPVPKFKGVPKKKQPAEPPKPKFKGKPKKKLEEERIAREKAEEEERRKREEEEQRRREEEEEKKRQEEEKLRKQKEEEQKRREEEAEKERKRQEEEKRREEDRKRLEDLRKQKELEEQKRREEEAEKERKRQEEEEARRKAAEEEARRKAAAEEARRKAAEEEARKKAAEEEARRKAAEEEARKKAEEEARIAKEKADAEKAKKKKAKKEKKEHPKPKVPPQQAPRPKPPGKQVATSDVYVALDVWYQKSEPTEEEYNALVNQTRDHYDKHLKKIWGDIYNGVEVAIRQKEFGAQKPNKNYNVYVEWDIFTYFEDGKEPKRYDVMVSLVRDMEVIEYLKYVRELENMCWANACSILHQQTVGTK